MSFNLKQEKINLRKEYKNKRLEMSSDERQRLDKKIANKVLNLWSFRESSVLLTYVSGTVEVDTHFIINEALRLGKKVAAPRCIDGTRSMDFYYIASFDDLSVRSYGILEPDIEKCSKVTDFSDSICIVPALCFDTDGYRLGFGKGYYDRFMSGYNGKTVGICYSECISTGLPHGRFDRRVNMLVTERQSYSITG